ncbi:MAG: two-component system sensor histidine kinase NtrB [Myxococcales bacterium]
MDGPARKLAAEQLDGSAEGARALLDALPDAVVVADAQGVIQSVNRQTEAIFGYGREELIGQPLEILLPESLRAHHAHLRRDYGARPHPRPARALVARRRDGSQFPVEVSLNPVPSADGPVVIAAIRDVTEKRSVEAQLMAADRLAAVGTLAAGVAHEINNPLAAVIGNLDAALQDLRRPEPGPDLAARLLEELRDSRDCAERIRIIVRDLRVFCHSDEDRRTLVDPRRIFESTLRMAQNEIRHRARLVTSYADVPSVEVNESRLGQVLLNLVVNAVQAIPEGCFEANEIRIATRGDSDEVVFEVADTGCGMSAEVRRHIFEPFFTTKPVGVGTGLGLAICHRIVAAQGGRIEVESEPGQGSVFRVHLPAVKSGEAGATAPPAEAAAAAGRRGRVLVVDDEEAVGKSVRRLLSPEHEVAVTTSAREALARLSAGERFDVILCDLMMPDLSGADFYEALQRLAPEQAGRMIFMTGGAFSERSRQLLASTASARIDKPFDFDRLRALIDEKLSARG